MATASPVFIHSLFRAGSTYLFNCFRRSVEKYCCYQEPLNEFLLNAGKNPEVLLNLHEDNTRHLRHPAIDLPYFYEFFPHANWVGDSFREEFSYHDYFNDSPLESEALCRYLTGLAEVAKGRAVFQECRSPGRVSAIRRCLGGIHLFLWRNPWDQWWSYKVDSHFEICNLQILAAEPAPAVFLELRERLGFAPQGRGVEHFVGQRLDAAGSYTLFFALWCHAMLTALPKCDFDINIDSLSHDETYRDALLVRLESHGITGLDFADCSIPSSLYGQRDQAFFTSLEEPVLELFRLHGYSSTDLEKICGLREQHRYCPDAKHWSSDKLGGEFDRLRQLIRRVESELAFSQREGYQRNAELAAKEAERIAAEQALRDEKAERIDAEKALCAKEAERQELASALDTKERALSQILSSRYWRFGKPVRALEKHILKWRKNTQGVMR